jgi:xylitol oxidase
MRTNWAGNQTYRSRRVERPASIEALQELVARETKVRVLGSRHSFSDIADTTGIHISLDRVPQVIEVDSDAECVTVSGAALYGDVARVLHSQGWALSNLASLPHISIGGAVATGTHGSGDMNVSLAAAVRALETVEPDGELRRTGRGDSNFDGSVVALGALGVVTRLTLDIEPAFDVAQTLYVGLPWDDLYARFDHITYRMYSASFFTQWVGDHVDQIWLKSRRGEGKSPERLYGATPAQGSMHMLPGGDIEAVTTQGGVYGPWLDRLPHFKMEFAPSRGDELQSEYLIPRDRTVDAFDRLRRLGPQIAPLLLTSEIRTVAADNLWLSGSYGRDVVAIHFTWLPDSRSVYAVLPAIEDALLPLGGRPHWGKCFAAGKQQLERLYPRFADFRDLVARTDPEGKFRNAFIDRTLGTGDMPADSGAVSA